MNFTTLVALLKSKGVKFTTGLNDEEILDIENYYDLKFPPDLKAFLKFSLPISGNFVNWRDKSNSNIEYIEERLKWPLEGIIFDIENNGFWMDGWGEKPLSTVEAVRVATQEYNKAPKLIPVYSHRCIPSVPNESGNPVLSVHQTDIIIYGDNLITYLMVEFNLKHFNNINFDNIKEIPFWSYWWSDS
ncbi:SMI1/KNR4 family protein [Neobacillus sp. PS3-34]|uniref:SMI1/KNR4 family protein n=1 Tax=Neobacillus sp. PS3-34 TaxID=3070678 RepID=UPI0027DFAB48|nr:SMI1/KNR4 family protein [Neobacillus sp. PS3-34]WML46624.1 SMI1/KNR4 family protein [Neobacillus sp. PS3-34]